jgi:hypothetical protein
MPHLRSSFIPAMLLSIAAGSLGCAAVPEPPPAAAAADTAELERAFWACDYVATTRGVSATPIAACRHATESLKREKFGGSFPALLEWWRDNKEGEHRKVERRLD